MMLNSSQEQPHSLILIIDDDPNIVRYIASILGDIAELQFSLSAPEGLTKA